MSYYCSFFFELGFRLPENRHLIVKKASVLVSLGFGLAIRLLSQFKLGQDPELQMIAESG